jgi:hypothetical protein
MEGRSSPLFRANIPAIGSRVQLALLVVCAWVENV